MKIKTVRELGGEIWAEVTMSQNLDTESDSLLKNIDYKTTGVFCELVMSVLARHVGAKIVNDEDLPVEPLAKRFPD